MFEFYELLKQINQTRGGDEGAVKGTERIGNMSQTCSLNSQRDSCCGGHSHEDGRRAPPPAAQPDFPGIS